MSAQVGNQNVGFLMTRLIYICGCNPSNRTQYSARFREYSVRRGMVRSIQYLRQIVRVFIKQYGYTHFFNFSVGQHHLDLDFFLARFARSMLKQWMIMSRCNYPCTQSFQNVSPSTILITSLQRLCSHIF